MIGRPAAQVGPSLADRLGQVRVGLREDLEVSRHIFRGDPSYIIRDPLTFHGQRLDLADYEILVSIDAARALSDIFDDLVRRGKLQDGDQERFYQFIVSLHSLGFLHLPLSDDKLLYRRYQLKERARRREKLMGFLFLRIPLWNPDAFLDRTIHLVRPLFGRLFFALWLLLTISAVWVVARNWDELFQPIHGVLAARNLPLMWVTLIVLKFFHELGHAYACKHHGGQVPEMGVYLIVFTPCAYMDASASWGFSRKRRRLSVCLAGMYVESVIAACAVYAWALTDSSLLHAVAYNVIFLASVVTVLFNINPLLRYDGYYIAGDLFEIPNLRQRAGRYVLDVLKRSILGIPRKTESGGRRLGAILFTYGVAAAVYRAVLIVAIAAILVSKVFVVGIALGTLFVGGIVFSTVRRLTAYLWYSEDTAPMRRRAVAVSVLLLIGLPGGLVFVPLPSNVQAAALISAERETVIRARTPGFLEEVHAECDQSVEAGEPVARLTNDSVLEQIAYTRANLRASEIHQDAYRVSEPARAQQEETYAAVYRRDLEEALSRQGDLTITAPHGGRMAQCVRDSDVGIFLPQGSPITAIIAGRWQARAILSEDQIARASLGTGDRVSVRLDAGPPRTLEGVVAKVAPAGSRMIEFQPLTHMGGGDIAVDPATHEAAQPYFVVTVDLPNGDAAHLRHLTTALIRFPAAPEPLVKSVGRRLIRFWNRLLQE
jgi:putative peptide zinc metalloprotease protein